MRRRCGVAAINRSTDMTTGSIWKRMVSFAVPVFLGNLCQQLYNTVDSVIVGKFVGKQALAAVASSGNLIFMMTGFFMGLFIGAGIVIAQYFGAKNYEKVRAAVHTDFAFALCCGVLLTLLGVFFTPTILTWMRTPADVLDTSILYFRLYFLGSLATILYNAGMGILQAVGDSRSPLRYLIISSITNVVLDILLIAVFKMDVDGAALATIISQFVSVFLCMGRLMNPVSGECQVKWREVRFDPEMTRMILSYGLPSGLQNSVIALANVVVQSNINSFGEMAMSGCGAYAKVEGFAFLPITSFTSAITTFVGQNLGAGELRRTRQGARFGILCSVIIAEAVGALLYWLAPILIKAFTQEPAAIAFGVQKMRTCSLFFCLLALSHCLAAVMRGAGRAVIPMISMLSFWCVVRVAIITVATPIYQSIAVVNWVYPITWALSSIFLLIYYYKADWLTAPGHRSGEPVKH